MKLSRRTFLLIAITIIALALVMNTMVFDTVSQRLKKSENQALSYDMDRVEALLQRECDVQMVESEDVAYWTLFHDYMQDPNGTFIPDMYFAGTMKFMNLNFIMVYDLDRNYVEGVFYDMEEGTIAPMPTDLLDFMGVSSEMITFVNETDENQMFAQVGEKVALFTSSAILTDEGIGPAAGYSVIGRYIDGSEITTLADLAFVDLTATTTFGEVPTDVAKALNDTSFEEEDRYYAILGEDSLAMYSPIRGEDGSVLMVFKISDDRSIYQGGMMSFKTTNTIMMFVLVAVGAALLLILNRNVLRPVTKLNRDIGSIGRSGDLSARVDSSGHVDEMVQLADSINTMLVRLEQNDAALKESERRYRDLVETSNDWVWQTDSDWKFIFSNSVATSQLGYGMDEIRERTLFDLLDPRDRESISRTMKEADRSIQVRKGVITMRSKDGREVLYEINAHPVFEADGRWMGYRGISRDITDRVLNEKELENANRQLTLLSSITRHDILNQVSILSGYRHLISETVKDPMSISYLERQQKAIDTIERQIRFTGVYQKLGTQEPVWNDMLKILRGVLNQAELRDMNVTVDLRQVEVLADPLMERVVYNLIDNAIRHSGARSLNVSDSERDGDLVISFQDDGRGVPEDQKERVFELGFGHNTGLGLFLAREILAITDITIVENGTPGEGAHFEMSIRKGHWRLR